MTTSLYKLRNEYGLDEKVMNLISSLLTKGVIPHKLDTIRLLVKPINGNQYTKRTKARVFSVTDAIKAVVQKPSRKYTVSTHQADIDIKLRGNAYSELKKVLEKETK